MFALRLTNSQLTILPENPEDYGILDAQIEDFEEYLAERSVFTKLNESPGAVTLKN